MKKAICVVVLSLFINFTAIADELQKALDLKPNIENGEKVYGLCATCHGKNGWGKVDGSFPVISGQHRLVVIKQLSDIRARDRDNPTMYPFSDPATIGGAQSIADVAAYIQSLPLNPEIGQGPGGHSVKQGKGLYQKHCKDCHGAEAEGLEANFFPRLRGQHFKYTVRQLISIRDGSRRNANPEMVRRVKELSNDEILSIADFLSRLPIKAKFQKEN